MADYDWPGDDAHWARIHAADKAKAARDRQDDVAKSLGYLPSQVPYARMCGTCYAIVSTEHAYSHMEWHKTVTEHAAFSTEKTK